MDKQEGGISFAQLVEVRREEMQHMRPGLMTQLTDGEHIVEVSSPGSFERSTFKFKQD